MTARYEVRRRWNGSLGIDQAEAHEAIIKLDDIEKVQQASRREPADLRRTTEDAGYRGPTSGSLG